VTEDFVKPEPDYWHPTKNAKFNPVFIRPSIIGIIVSDIDEKIKEYDYLGINPWEVHEFNKEYLGFKTKMAFCRFGNILFKMIEPGQGSLFSGFLNKYGEGVHHIKMEVEDYERTLEYFESKNVEVIFSGEYNNGIRFSYINTLKHLNFITEISNKSISIDEGSGITVHP
jgi:hypothetical protein